MKSLLSTQFFGYASLFIILGTQLTACGKNSPSPYPSSPYFRTDSTNECHPKDPIGRIYLDCTIPKGDYEIIKGDLEFLRTMRLEGPKAFELQRMLHLPKISGAELLQWIENQVQFVLDVTFDRNIKRTVGGVNISNSLINFFRNPFAVVEVPGFGPVEIRSQKVGVIQLGPYFFIRNEMISLRSRIDRLSILFHEARHNQGRGVSNGFPHVPCPNGHQEGSETLACDICSNGPHGLENSFLQSTLEACDQNSFECTANDRWGLEFSSRWSTADILPDAKECDDSLEFL